MNFFKATIKEEKTLKKIIRKIEKRHFFYLLDNSTFLGICN